MRFAQVPLRLRLDVSFLLAVVAVIAGCGGVDDERRPRKSGAAVDLVITVRAPGGEQRSELECDPADDERRCATARKLAAFLATEPPRNRICTQIYGGPERARIVGTIGRRKIDRRFSKTNGCAIAEWRRIEPLLPGAG